MSINKSLKSRKNVFEIITIEFSFRVIEVFEISQIDFDTEVLLQIELDISPWDMLLLRITLTLVASQDLVESQTYIQIHLPIGFMTFYYFFSLIDAMIF